MKVVLMVTSLNDDSHRRAGQIASIIHLIFLVLRKSLVYGETVDVFEYLVNRDFNLNLKVSFESL